MKSILFLIKTYPLFNKDNLMQPINVQLSQKEKSFSRISFAFLKSILNFEHFRKKDHLHNRCISEITDSKKRD